MRVIKYSEARLDECAELWWSIYRDCPYVHRPDGGQTVNTDKIGPDCFGKHLRAGFGGAGYWVGEVTPDTVFLAEHEGYVVGILVCSVQHDPSVGGILSAYMHRDRQGRGIASCLLGEALDHFRRLGLHSAMAGPHVSKSLEVECPIHLALLDAGFAWEDIWEGPPDEDTGMFHVKEFPVYVTFLGGSLEGFGLRPEIEERIERLRGEGITIEKCYPDQFSRLRRYGSGGPVDTMDDETQCAFVAFMDGKAVGWTFEIYTFEDEGSIMGQVGPEVIPSFRRKGIGKVVHHLGMAEAVRLGAEYGWTATGICNPARLIYQSVGWQYWYLGFGLMSRPLR